MPLPAGHDATSPESITTREALITSALSPRLPPDGRLFGSWPITDVAELGGLRRAAVRVARGEQLGTGLRPQQQDDEGLGGLETRIALVVSELVANALRHGSPPRALALHRVPGGWLVDVLDGATTLSPVAHRPDPTRAGQNGLHIVALLSEDWGWHVDGRSKHVWAKVPDDDEAGHHGSAIDQLSSRQQRVPEVRRDEAG